MWKLKGLRRTKVLYPMDLSPLFGFYLPVSFYLHLFLPLFWYSFLCYIYNLRLVYQQYSRTKNLVLALLRDNPSLVVMPNFEREEHSTFSLKPPKPRFRLFPSPISSETMALACYPATYFHLSRNKHA